MSGPATVLLAGATGLVGGHAAARWLAAPAGPRLIAPVRRAPASAHPRLQVLVGGWDEAALREALQGQPLDVFACCLGTTLRQAGSREAFLAVDRDLVLALGSAARRLGARQALLVSSVGASAQSGNFYLRVKGEAERGLAALGFERCDFLRPGLLLGGRSQKRPAEQWGQRLAPLYSPVLRGRLRRYRPIPAEEVAAALVVLAGQEAPGRFVHEFAELRALAGRPG